VALTNDSAFFYRFSVLDGAVCWRGWFNMVAEDADELDLKSATRFLS
jgi:hypothetical protein